MEEIILLKLCMVKNNRYGNNCLLSVHVKKKQKKTVWFTYHCTITSPFYFNKPFKADLILTNMSIFVFSVSRVEPKLNIHI